jgi:hypothetical protein
MTRLNSHQQYLLLSGSCPICHGWDFVAGPRGGECRNVLCVMCLAEYNVGPLTAELLGHRASEDRQADVYHVLRRCRVCRCTDNRACVTEAGPCSWFSWDLCTACAPRVLAAGVVLAIFDARKLLTEGSVP